MAKAIAMCTCKECGETFKKEATRNSRREADAWVVYAKENYDVCPHCWAKAQREKQRSTPTHAEIILDVHELVCIIVLRGNTIDHKDEIKAMGYRWTTDPMLDPMRALMADKKCWSKTVKFEEIDAIINELKENKIEVRSQITEEDIEKYNKNKKKRDEVNEEKEEKESKMDEEISEIAKPERPATLDGGSWNGKVYGKMGRYNIYLSSKKKDLTNEEAEEIENYMLAKSKYIARVKEIENKYGKEV